MGYIGNEAQTAFTSFDKQTITGTNTAVYTLTHSVANEQEIEVFVNNVRQEGGAGKAFTVSGNQITFTENIASTDDVYVNFAGKAVQTVTHPSDAPLQATTGTFSSNVDVGGSLLVDTIKDGAGTNTAMTIDSGGRVTQPARPAFLAVNTAAFQTTNSGSVIGFNSTIINRGNHFDISTYTFTAPIAGLYNFYWQVYEANGTTAKQVALQKNGSDYMVQDTAIANQGAVDIGGHTLNASLMMDLVVNDEIRIAVRANSQNLYWYGGHSWFQGYFIG